MKKLRSLLLSLALSLLCSNQAFSQIAFINPFIDPLYNGNTLTGTSGTSGDLLRARFFVSTSSLGAPGIFGSSTLNFFSSSGVIDVSSIELLSIVTPGTWAGSVVGPLISITSSGPGTSFLEFEFGYKLLVPANSNLSLWHSGTIWGLNGSVTTTPAGQILSYSTGHAPEPGTVMLLGAGLLGMGLAGRIRQRFRGENKEIE